MKMSTFAGKRASAKTHLVVSGAIVHLIIVGFVAPCQIRAKCLHAESTEPVMQRVKRNLHSDVIVSPDITALIVTKLW